MQIGLVARKVSVCPSVKRMDCDKTEEKSVQIFIPYKRPLLPELFGQPAAAGAKSPILNRYSLVPPQPNTQQKKFN